MGWFDFLFSNSDCERERRTLETRNKQQEDLIKSLTEQLADYREGKQEVDTAFTWDKSKIESISKKELRDRFSGLFPGCEIKIAKATYKYIALDEVQRWASFDPTNELQYRDNELNCENYALTDMAEFRKEDNFTLGNGAFGLAWGWAMLNGVRTYHAWNICYTGDLYFLEPQSDDTWIWNDFRHPIYQPDFIYI